LIGAAIGAGLSAAAFGWMLKAHFGLSSATQPFHQILGSIGLNITLLAAWLVLLPLDASPWSGLRAWLQGTLIAAGAFTGLYFSGSESARTFLALWLLAAAQGGMLCATAGVAALAFGSPALARQSSAVVLALAVTTLFWSRTPIQTAPRPENDAVPLSDIYYDAVLKLSPPLATSAVWYQESDVSRRKLRTEGSAFDIIRGPKTYEIWVGSYTILPYPAVYPKRDAETNRFTPGLILSLLIWGLPALLVCDLLLFLRYRRSPFLASGAL